MTAARVGEKAKSMQDSAQHISNPVLSDSAFQSIGALISSELGIKMPAVKKTMLQGRLARRLRQLKMASFDTYSDYLFSPEGKARELVHMLDAVTTNKTDFFREPRHFDILTQTVLPELVHHSRAGGRRRTTLWSAGCATGAEPYTLAMVLAEFARGCEGFDYAILATDISTRVLAKAREAIYTESEVAPIPLPLKKNYLLRSKNRQLQQVRVAPEIRQKVAFSRLNFMDAEYAAPNNLDVVFCRNVIIYFDRPTQQLVLRRLCRHLLPGGYLFVGHSETLNGFHLPLRQVAATVYRKEV
jgi:chemotaxis protein methyltransferase CheR